MSIFNPRKLCVVLLGVIMLLTTSCETPSAPQDIISLKKTSEDKIPITISTKYSVYLDELERFVEEKLPNLDLIQVGNFTSNYSDEYAQQMANDDLTDIIVTWPLDKAAKECEDKLIDLSSLDVTLKYNISMLNSLSKDGELYYLPGPTSVRGIMYNKTMFEENGWQVPNDFEGFIDLCKEIEDSGIRSLQLSLWNKEVLRYAFEGFGYGDSFVSPKSTDLMNAYLQGEGSLRDFALPAFKSYERLIDEGIIKPSDLDVRYPMREQMLFNRQCAMVSDSVDLISLAKRSGNKTDEFAIMPFFCPGKNNSWGHLVPTQYIGLNKNLEESENKEKYDLVLKILDLISTPEGQLVLSNGMQGMVSSLVGAPLPNTPELAPMMDTIKKSRYAVFPTITYAEDTLYEALAAMLRGEIMRDEAIDIVDKENKNPAPATASPTIGNATDTFSLMEVGNYVTDVLRKEANTDFALFLDNGRDGAFNAKGISAKLYKGNIRESDVTMRIFPVLQHGETGYMNIVKMSGENLTKAIEYGLGKNNWFYYFSGLKVTMDPVAKLGKRLESITDENGKAIDPKKIYSVAVLEGSVADKYITSTKTTKTLITDLLINDIKEKENITPANDDRFTFPSKSKS